MKKPQQSKRKHRVRPVQVENYRVTDRPNGLETTRKQLIVAAVLVCVYLLYARDPPPP
uniref:Uncharacterized protein n=1 Tax=Arundo donax TaxID=35708 RepID=A0A0A8YWR4_ARUDO